MNNRAIIIAAAMRVVEPPKFYVGQEETNQSIRNYAAEVRRIVYAVERQFTATEVNWDA